MAMKSATRKPKPVRKSALRWTSDRDGSELMHIALVEDGYAVVRVSMIQDDKKFYGIEVGSYGSLLEAKQAVEAALRKGKQ